MPTIEDRAKLMAEGTLGRAEGACALESHLALPAEWRGTCGPLLLVDVSPVSYIAAFRDGRKTAGKTQSALAAEISIAVKTYIRDMVGDVNPAACILAFDSPVKTFRSGLLARYKAQRAKKRSEYDEEQKKLNDARMEAVEGMWLAPELRPGCNAMRKAGYEADDMIAVFVHALRVTPTGERMSARQRIMVATSDKDLSQLLDFANVDVLDVGKRTYVTAKSFAQKEGYPPSLIPALKAIAGDTSDNIPGIRDIGEKTALKFLRGSPLTDRERGLLEAGWADAEEYYDLVRLPFPGCSLKGCPFDASLDPDDLFGPGGSEIMPF
ncbi:MAG: hypothetical protein WCS18_12470 [Sphaerochaetaceae bacterium]